MDNGILLGHDTQTGEPVYLPHKHLPIGTAITGIQGMGKTNLLKNVFLQFIESGGGGAVLTPHPDLIFDLIPLLPEDRRDDAQLLDPADDYPPGLVGIGGGDTVDGVWIENEVDKFISLFQDEWKSSWGARMEEVMRSTARVILYTQNLSSEKRPTLAEFISILSRDGQYRQRLLTHVQDQNPSTAIDELLAFWDRFEGLTMRVQEEWVGSTLNKVSRFRVNPLVAHVVGQGHLRKWSEAEAMAESKIVFIPLDVDKLGEGNVRVLGKLILRGFFNAGLARPLSKDNSPFLIVLDEFSYFATPAVASMQDQLRKYNVFLQVAMQRRSQLGPETRSSTLSAGNWIVFRVNPEDAEDLAKGFDSQPPGPEVRSQRQGLTLVSSPWNSLRTKAHERSEVNELYHRISEWLVLKTNWDYGSQLCPRFGITDPTWADFVIWGFPDEGVRGRCEQRLNHVLYSMMNRADGAAIEPRLLTLAQSLFSYRAYQDNYGRPIFQPIGQDWPLGADWGATTLGALAARIRAYLLEHGQEMRDYKEGHHILDHFDRNFAELRQLTSAFARTYARHNLVPLIASLGYRLSKNQMWVRAGQPEPDYEMQRPYGDVTNEWRNILTHLPRYQAMVRIQDEGEFHVITKKAPDVPENAEQIINQVRQQSREQYGVKREEIERALRERVKDFSSRRQTGYADDPDEVPASGRRRPPQE